MSAYLLDATVLIALVVREHEHHDRASDWLTGVQSFAVCPLVEGALVRFMLRMGESATTAAALLHDIRAHSRCQFWSDDISYLDVDLAEVHGHRQVTDVYLAELAAAHHGQLATFDKALSALRPATTLAIS